jgi:prepilin-type N-terminal cleavage/methylation domain-containing protein
MIRKAFTLIELLVVIGIIAILAAILFPVFAQAKESAKKSTCLSNTTQIGMALYMYLNDFDDFMPMANYSSSPTNAKSNFSYLAGGASGYVAYNWADLLVPYSHNFAFFKCQDDVSGPLLVGGVAVPGYPLSYALNYYFYSTPTGFTGSVGGPNMSTIQSPSQKLFVVESDSAISQEIVSPRSTKRLGFTRHFLGSNWVYADTHAKFHTMPVAWTQIPDATWKSATLAAATGYNQWFPWVDGPEVW